MSYVHDHQAIVNTQGIRNVKKMHRKASSFKTDRGENIDTAEAWIVEVTYKGQVISYTYAIHESALDLFAAIVKKLKSTHAAEYGNQVEDE